MYSTRIDTLTIHSENIFTREEDEFLNALSYTFLKFSQMSGNNYFSMYIGTNTFLISEHNDNEDIDPFCFVNEKGEILFDVNIKVFAPEIDEFQKYINYRQIKNPNLPYEKILQAAIKDYKNDKLDFYANSRIISKELINKARKIYDENLER